MLPYKLNTCTHLKIRCVLMKYDTKFNNMDLSKTKQHINETRLLMDMLKYGLMINMNILSEKYITKHHYTKTLNNIVLCFKIV